MLIKNRGDLHTFIAKTLDRTDLVDEIPVFVQLFEATINTSLRHHEMICRTRTTTDSQFTPTPPDTLEFIRLECVSEVPHWELTYKEPRELLRYREGICAGSPRFYTLLGRRIELAPTPSEEVTLEIVHYERVKLGDANSATNWLLEQAPNVYLYGALSHTAPYLKNDARLTMWSELAKSALMSLDTASKTMQTSGSRLNRGNSTGL